MPTASQETAAKELVRALLRWYRRHHRKLPWRATRDPYPVWVSEIMLQQTRVSTVLPYYGRFLEKFPTVEALADAGEQQLLECWSGLGYYRRARQMQRAARQIVANHGGRFPSSYQELRALPGIGDYTAAAIASICFGRPHAVLDGNVIRVLTRLLDDGGDIRAAGVRKRLQKRAQELLEQAGARNYGHFNQAVMELGATLCLPRNPKCPICPVAGFCLARERGVQEQRPVKTKKEKTERLELAVAIVRRGSSLLLRQRPARSSLMPGFWELPEVQGVRLDEDCFRPLGIRRRERLGEFRHGITFRAYRGSVYRGSSNGKAPKGYAWVPARRIPELPLTTITRKALAVFESSKPPKFKK